MSANVSAATGFDLSSIKHAHFVGIGGIGMMALAQYVSQRGVRVTGSDRSAGMTTDMLQREGIDIVMGHDPSNLGDADLVILTAAISGDNAEVAEARRRGISTMARSELLGYLVNGSLRSLAISGTHGKTTTTALTGHLLRHAGLNATVLGGGLIRQRDGSLIGPGIVGDDRMLVAEADEFARSFLALHPTVSIITAIDFDHPDCYTDIGDMVSAYAQLASQTRDLLIVSDSAPRAVDVGRRSRRPMETYGMSADATWQVREQRSDDNGANFRLSTHGVDRGTFRINIPGQHNLLNAVAALAASTHLSGVETETFAPHLESFVGVGRRLELVGRVDGITVVDDYAHHPVEVAAALDALREQARSLRVIFQPHTFSRTKALMAEFARAFSLADQVVLVDVYAARETPPQGAGTTELLDAMQFHHSSVRYSASLLAAVRDVVEPAEPGDVIVTMGAGDVGEWGSMIVRELEGAHASTV